MEKLDLGRRYAPEFESVLKSAAFALNAAGIVWSAGGSALLRRLGCPEHPNDLDLVVAMPDADAAHEALSKLGSWERGEPKPPFASRHFFRYRIHGISVEVIGGFRIMHADGTFELPFGADDLEVKRLSEEGEESFAVPLGLPGDWWLAYRLMLSASKQAKADWLYKLMLARGGCPHLDRLQRLLEQPLPQDVREQGERLLSGLSSNV